MVGRKIRKSDSICRGMPQLTVHYWPIRGITDLAGAPPACQRRLSGYHRQVRGTFRGIVDLSGAFSSACHGYHRPTRGTTDLSGTPKTCQGHHRPFWYTAAPTYQRHHRPVRGTTDLSDAPPMYQRHCRSIRYVICLWGAPTAYNGLHRLIKGTTNIGGAHRSTLVGRHGPLPRATPTYNSNGIRNSHEKLKIGHQRNEVAEIGWVFISSFGCM